MPIALAVVVAGVVAWGVTHRLGPRLVARAPVQTTNYRGLRISTGVGLAAIVGALASFAVLSVIPIATEAGPVARATAAWPVVVALVGFGLLGAWDDLAVPATGNRTPPMDLARGGMRAVAGIAVAIVATPPSGIVPRIVSAALVYLAATAGEGREPRPGRSGKMIVATSVLVLILSMAERTDLTPVIAALAVASATILPLDLRERATLGRLGTSSLGAALAVAGSMIVGTGTELLILAILIGFRLLARSPRATAAITSKGPLARLDSIGRVPETRSVSTEHA